MVGGAIVLSATAVLWLRYRPPYQFGKERSNLVTLGLSHVAVITAFGMVPALMGLVAFGGLSFYYLGLGATLLLLLVPGRPDEAMFDALASSSGSEITGSQLWQAMLEPARD